MNPPPAISRKMSIASIVLRVFVIALLVAIVVGLFIPGGGGLRQGTRKIVARNDETQIVTGIKAYYKEYGRYPIEDTEKDVVIDTPAANARLIDILRNNTGNPATADAVKNLNPRGILFLAVPVVKDKAHPCMGIMPDGNPNAGVWYDAWGSPYQVAIDGNYDGKITNPYQDTPGGAEIPAPVIAWSLAKNGILGGGAAEKEGFAKEPRCSR